MTKTIPVNEVPAAMMAVIQQEFLSASADFNANKKLASITATLIRNASTEEGYKAVLDIVADLHYARGRYEALGAVIRGMHDALGLDEESN